MNGLWQADLSYGPYLRLGRKKAATYLLAFIDDASRLVPFAGFCRDQSFDSLKTVFKEALCRRGIPEKVYTDNGKHPPSVGPRRSGQFQFVCASLGIALIHAKPYDAAAKGKIERFFLTVKERFYSVLAPESLTSLEALNQAFAAWLNCVASVIPAELQAYARVLHPAVDGDGWSVTCAEVARRCGRIPHREMQRSAIIEPRAIGDPEAGESRGGRPGFGGPHGGIQPPPVGVLPATPAVSLVGVLKKFTLDIPAARHVRTFSDWTQAFGSISELPGTGKKLVIIDEFPYMDKGNPSIPSILQNLWDACLIAHCSDQALDRNVPI